jgi:WhiB family transcriptional regulator, redox-sensing transcriptional regulator
MAPMHWPGTAAVLEGPAGFETGFAAQAALLETMTGTGPAAVPVTSTTAIAGVPSGCELPCGDDPELFFAESPEDVEYAKSLCRSCPARIACLDGAIERREPWGVWGGELFLRGEVVPRKRPRGRPRKTDVAA